MSNKAVLISQEIYKSIMGYLGTRPFEDVHQIIDVLSKSQVVELKEPETETEQELEEAK